MRAQTISIRENDPAQHTTVINARFVMALREKAMDDPSARPQPIQITHLQSLQGA
jgi:hypothetical protein